MKGNIIMIKRSVDSELQEKTISILNDQSINVGITSYIYDVYENLKAHGFSVNLHQFFADMNEKTYDSSTKIHHGYRLFGKYSQTANILLGIASRKLNKEKADIIHLSSPSLMKHIRDYSNLVLTVHDLCYLSHNSNSRIVSYYYKSTYNQLHKSKVVITVSNFTRQALIENSYVNEEDTFVSYPSIDTSFFYPRHYNFRSHFGFTESDKVILHVGYDNPTKNLKGLYEILKALPDQYKLIRVGKNFRGSLDYASKIGVMKKIKFLDSIERDQLPVVYNSADLFLFPSICEGFGIPPVEAMATGLPTFVSNNSSLPEVVGNGGFVLESLDPKYVAGIIEDHLNDAKRLRDLSAKALKRAVFFSRDNQLDSLTRAYKHVL